MLNRRCDRVADYQGYGRRNLYNMVAVYDAFSSNEFVELLQRCKEVLQPVAGHSIPPVLFLTTFQPADGKCLLR